MKIQIKYKDMHCQLAEQRFLTTIKILKKYETMQTQQDKLDFIDEINSLLPVVITETTKSIHIKPIIKMLNQTFLFCDEAEGVQVKSTSTTTKGVRICKVELLNIPKVGDCNG